MKKNPLVYSTSNPETKSTELHMYLKNAISGYSEPKPSSQRKFVKNLPWVSPYYLILRKRKQSLYILKKRYPNNQDLLISYKKCARQERNLRKNLIKKCLNNKLESVKGNSKAMWNTLNSIFCRKSVDKSSEIIKLKITNSALANPASVANALNDFFIGVGDSDTSTLDLSPFEVPLTILSTFTLINNDSMLSFVNTLKDKSYSPDGIPARVIKILASIYPPVITHFLNASLESAVVLGILKKGDLRPISKNRCRDEVANRRPLTMTSHLSKLLEKPVF